ncbi:hypothetical protein H109_02447 [Trichophyton interdigitale MR816]|uniref:Uncharacterized protein n=1 Tax=Trichophyton interdigitale (strain MR816) TaxID=1215338 RepID=A0A059JD09_TRIIM|nr:hypothetical protein H109_02447 [Trichophyton interdigitale MR816]
MCCQDLPFPGNKKDVDDPSLVLSWQSGKDGESSNFLRSREYGRMAVSTKPARNKEASENVIDMIVARTVELARTCAETPSPAQLEPWSWDGGGPQAVGHVG